MVAQNIRTPPLSNIVTTAFTRSHGFCFKPPIKLGGPVAPPKQLDSTVRNSTDALSRISQSSIYRDNQQAYIVIPVGSLGRTELLGRIGSELPAAWTLTRRECSMFLFLRISACLELVLNHFIRHRSQMSVYLCIRRFHLLSIYGLASNG